MILSDFYTSILPSAVLNGNPAVDPLYQKLSVHYISLPKIPAVFSPFSFEISILFVTVIQTIIDFSCPWIFHT